MRLPDSLRSLRHRDLQLFFGGQAVSLLGTWMQSVAQSWLVYRLWHDPRLLGEVSFLGQLPVFLLGAWAGSVADRLPRRKLVLATQSLAALQAGTLAAVTLSGHIQLWHLLALAALLGVVNAFDVPSRQAYLTDMAREDLGNAIAFNSTLVNGTRILGPAVGGYVVALVGEGYCFLLNALSYVAVIGALSRTRAEAPRAERRAGHFREGLRYAWEMPHTRSLLGLVGFGSLVATPYVVLMPVFAKDVFGGGAELQGRLLGSAGVGAFLGALGLLRNADRDTLGQRVARGSLAFGCGLVAFSLAPRVWVAMLALVCVGWGFMTQMASANTLLQTLTPQSMRGRVMGLYSMAFIGMGPFGSLALGYGAAHLGPRWAVGLGGTLLALAALLFRTRVPKLHPGPTQPMLGQ